MHYNVVFMFCSFDNKILQNYILFGFPVVTEPFRL